MILGGIRSMVDNDKMFDGGNKSISKLSVVNVTNSKHLLLCVMIFFLK